MSDTSTVIPEKAIGTQYPVFERHLGVWEGTYTLIDRATGEVLDRHRSQLTCRKDGDQWSQSNHYTWEDGRTEVKGFDGEFRDGKLYFDTPKLKGEAEEAGDSVIILTWTYKDDPTGRLAEIITLIDDDHRARTWQHFEHGEFTKLTVIDERRAS